MPTGTLISVEEYLATSYRPDCDYVDGRLEERNVGEWDHSKIQAAIVAYFFVRRKAWGISVAPEQRVQVNSTRFRVPDVCVLLGEPKEQIFRTPPFLCVEILSPEDRMNHAIAPGQVERKGLGGHDTRTLLKIFPQQRSRPMEPGLDSFRSDVQASGRLGYRHALDGAQHEDHSIDLRQRIDRTLQHDPEFVVVRLPLRISCV